MAKRKLANAGTAVANRVNDVVCKNCRIKINGRKDTSVKCAQCGGWVHLRCSKLKAVDLKEPDKVKALKCKRCKLQSLNIDGSSSAEENEDVHPDMAMDTAAATSSPPNEKNYESFLKQILIEMKHMSQAMLRLEEENIEIKATMTKLVAANMRLEKQVSLLSKNLEKRSNITSERSRLRSRDDKARSESRVRVAAGRHVNTDYNASGARLPVQQRPRQGSRQRTASATANKTLIKKVCHSNVCTDPSQTQSSSYRLPAVRARINTRRLHVANLCPTISAETVYNHLVTQAGVHAVTVKKLRSRTATCGRFYVEVLDVDYDNVLKDELWESDTELSFYRGPLRNDLVTESFPKD